MNTQPDTEQQTPTAPPSAEEILGMIVDAANIHLALSGLPDSELTQQAGPLWPDSPEWLEQADGMFDRLTVAAEAELRKTLTALGMHPRTHDLDDEQTQGLVMNAIAAGAVAAMEVLVVNGWVRETPVPPVPDTTT